MAANLFGGSGCPIMEVAADVGLDCQHLGDGAWWEVKLDATEVVRDSPTAPPYLRVVYAADGMVEHVPAYQAASRIRLSARAAQDSDCPALVKHTQVLAAYCPAGEEGVRGYYDALITNVHRMPHGPGEGLCRCTFSWQWRVANKEQLPAAVCRTLPPARKASGPIASLCVGSSRALGHPRMQAWLQQLREGAQSSVAHSSRQAVVEAGPATQQQGREQQQLQLERHGGQLGQGLGQLEHRHGGVGQLGQLGQQQQQQLGQEAHGLGPDPPIQSLAAPSGLPCLPLVAAVDAPLPHTWSVDPPPAPTAALPPSPPSHSLAGTLSS
ncbi:hypothetical protein V8C86DRAFT_3151340 [Haematococcus lacustris]